MLPSGVFVSVIFLGIRTNGFWRICCGANRTSILIIGMLRFDWSLEHARLLSWYCVHQALKSTAEYSPKPYNVYSHHIWLTASCKFLNSIVKYGLKWCVRVVGSLCCVDPALLPSLWKIFSWQPLYFDQNTSGVSDKLCSVPDLYQVESTLLRTCKW